MGAVLALSTRMFKSFKTRHLILGAVFILSSFTSGAVQAAGPSCSRLMARLGAANAVTAETQVSSKPLLNSSSTPEQLNLNARVKDRNGHVIADSLQEALNLPQVKSLIDGDRAPYRIYLTADLPANQGGGKLRLIRLNEGSGNRAYNHVELTALLRVNPELANSLGFYRVEGHHDVVWAPDITTVNFRMRRLARQYGYSNSVWGYEAAAGVISTRPYLELLAKGKFPFSGDADVNLSVHDAMHSIAFTVLNITDGGRSVLRAAESRNQVILNIDKRLQAEVGGQYSNNFVENIAKHISSDPMERTMLLTIILTGNYDYFSAYNVRANNSGRYFTKQNPTTTRARIKELLRLYNYGTMSFATALERLAPVGDPKHDVIQQIFREELVGLKSASDSEMEQAATEIMRFIPQDVLSRSAAQGPTTNSSVGGDFAPAGPETLQAQH